MAQGQIIQSISGFYYVEDGGEIYQTRARGSFRNDGITPLVGDFVEYESTSPSDGYILDIKERKNELVRPPIANIDYGIVIMSYKRPDFSSLMLDRMLVHLESKRIEALIYLTKEDLLEEDEKDQAQSFEDLYSDIGYFVESIGFHTDFSGVGDRLEEKVSGQTAVFMGQSGAGKSTLLNQLDENLDLDTQEISQALGRGRHTTRTVQLLPLLGGRVADTPGFSSLELDTIEKEELPYCFREFRALAPQCKFRGCMHLHEPQCQVKAELEEGRVAKSRYDNYLTFLEEIEGRKPRY